jgi:tetratricopeptide (TPR) repeat protein
MIVAHRRWSQLAPLALALVALSAVSVGCATGGRSSAEEKGPLHHYQLARMFFERGKAARALEQIDRALEMDDQLPQVHFYQGYIHWSLGNWPEAEAAFRSAIALNPMYVDARMYLASCLEERGDPEAALGALDAALALRNIPKREQVLFNKALVLRRQGRLGGALRLLRQAVEARPRYYRAHFEMAGVLEEAGRLEEALEALEAAAPGYERNAEFHYRRGATLFRLRRAEAAARDLRRAIELAPGSETARRARDLLEVIG